MSLEFSLKSIADACDAEVAALHERIPNHTATDGTVTEFFATDAQVQKIVGKAVSDNLAALQADLVQAVRDVMAEGPKAPNVIAPGVPA